MSMHHIKFPVLTIRETVNPARIDDVRAAAMAEVTRLIGGFRHPDEDLRPFILFGNGEGVHALNPTFPEEVSVPFEEQLSMFIEQIGPMVLTQKDATCGALVLTVWTAPRAPGDEDTRAADHPERQEAVAVMLTDAGGAAQTLLATLVRHRFKPPELQDFIALSDRVQPSVAEAFERGYRGLG